LAVNVASDGYVNLIQGMRFILAQFQRKIELQQSSSSKVLDVHWEEAGRLYKVTDELEAALASVSKLLAEEVPIRNGKINTRRATRGLINILGYGLKYLLGTADARDVKRLNDICDNLRVFKRR
jgi:hypothetical protein